MSPELTPPLWQCPSAFLRGHLELGCTQYCHGNLCAPARQAPVSLLLGSRH
jgi:hypothetical protein